MSNSLSNKIKRFRLEMDIVVPIPRTVTYSFTSLKFMRQWQKRNELDNALWCMAYQEYILNENNEWERFTVFGKSIVRKSQLEAALKQMKDEGFNSSLIKK